MGDYTAMPLYPFLTYKNVFIFLKRATEADELLVFLLVEVHQVVQEGVLVHVCNFARQHG